MPAVLRPGGLLLLMWSRHDRIFGLIVLVAALVVGVAVVLGNGGSGHALTHGFAVFGYHVTGSTGTLFLYGIVVGAIALAGLSLLLAGARRTSRPRGSAARRGLRQSRRETAAVSTDRDDLIGQRDARAHTASALGNGTPRSASSPGPGGALRAAGRSASPRCHCRYARPRRAPHERQPPVSAARRPHWTEAVKGAVMKIAGRVTGNRRLRAGNRRSQAKGNIKRYGAKIKDAFGR